MDVGPARQPRSPLVFQVGAEPHFPHLERFPTLDDQKSFCRALIPSLAGQLWSSCFKIFHIWKHL